MSTETTNANNKKRIGLGQLTSINNKTVNFEKCKGLIEKAANSKVDLFCLPECFAFIGGGVDPMDSRNNAEYIDQPDGTIEKFRDLAKKHSMWLSLGGFHEKILEEPDQIYNTHLIIDSSGEIVVKYHKMHLFDVDIPSKGVSMNESKVVKSGDEIMVCKSPVGNLGISICYDVRFPEFYLTLRQMGAEIILVPSAFTYTTGKAHWSTLLRARAIENQCYVVAAAQTGNHHPKRKSYGHSLIVDPWGEVLCEIDENVTDEIAYCDIDLNFLNEIRENLPVYSHKKYDCYNINKKK
ncbi:hypothetical protein DICPUDRAFT_42388 [Dictyostelium purpureum]|uniref:CN hydrolase domain-containing protein n=1 Tax=Dictyostelium purpureum TaxID=5786 RepID=F1A1Z8_DICPU|nr:uncharacterized protein DICPUDRAFT_42388 [Dictyostelium purpureum]EGC29787.1 hypothetical protein DICPUDRAFT_42388 [Dictyostelium purpureum]|eukprot:XP_003293695.1 hypothetical protein DICPUDRAFT_42388 [Dictyostelium purpureum]